MRAQLVVEPDVAADVVLALVGGLVGAKIDLFVFDGSPEPLNEHVVAPSALPVHADGNAVPLEEIDEAAIGELAALVGIEDLGTAMLGDRLLDGVDAEIGREAVGKPPGHHVARKPIHDDEQVEETVAHRDVRNIGAPGLIGAIDDEVSEKIGEDGMLGIGFSAFLLAVERFNAHQAHQAANVPTSNPIAAQLEHVTQHPGAGERSVGVQPIDQAH